MTATTMSVERVNFFDEQKRRRRGAARLRLLCMAIAGTIGAILSTFVGPLVIAAFMLVLRLLSIIGLGGLVDPVRAATLAWINDGAASFLAAMDGISDANDFNGFLAILPHLGHASSLLLPSLICASLYWWWFAALKARTASAAAITAMQTRDPRPNDFEETQLGNIVAEMALAAGIPTPRLQLIDSPSINAAAVGASHEDSTIVVSRAMLDKLDREETIGIIAHLTGAIGSGDLRLSAGVESIFITLGTFLTVFDLPYRLGAWRTFGVIGAAMIGRSRADEVNNVARSASFTLSPDSSHAMLNVLKIGERWPPLGAILILPLLPFSLVAIMQKLIVQMWMLFFLNWPIALLWRTRRRLSDAVAVQLTRDPQGLIRALERLSDEKTLPDNAEFNELAFIHSPEEADKGFSQRYHITMGLTPSIASRINRLQKQAAGGQVVASRPSFLDSYLQQWRERPLIALLISVLLAAIVPLVATIVVLVGGLTVLTVMMSAAAGVFLMQWAAGL